MSVTGPGQPVTLEGIQNGRYFRASALSRTLSRCRPEGDPATFTSLLVRPHYDLDVTIKRGKKSHEPIDRVFAEITFEQARHLGLADAHAFSRLRLRQFPLMGKPIDFRDDLRLEEMGLGVRQAEVGENISAAHFDFDFTGHGFCSSLNRSA